MDYRLRMRGALLVVMASILLAACGPREATRRAPTREEVEDFAEREGVEIIGQELVGESMVVLFQDETEYGYYKITVDQALGRLAVEEMAAGQRTDGPVLVFGDGPFAGVVIQDEEMLRRTTVVAVDFTGDQRVTKPAEGRKGLVLLSPVPQQAWEKVRLYDAAGEVLYEESR